MKTSTAWSLEQRCAGQRAACPMPCFEYSASEAEDPQQSPTPSLHRPPPHTHTQIFHLLPPCDAYRMALTELPCASYQPDPATGQLVPVLADQGGGDNDGTYGSSSAAAAAETAAAAAPQRVTWSPIEPQPADLAAARQQYPLFFDPSLPPPLVAEVGPGDVLYLPSLWFHYVAQRSDPLRGDCVIAVNHWYDMHYGAAWAHFKVGEREAGHPAALHRMSRITRAVLLTLLWSVFHPRPPPRMSTPPCAHSLLRLLQRRQDCCPSRRLRTRHQRSGKKRRRVTCSGGGGSQ